MCYPVPFVDKRLTIPFNGGREDEVHFGNPQSEKASSPGEAGDAGFGGVGVQAVQGQYDQLKALASGAAGQVQSMKAPFGDPRTPQGT